MEQIKPKKRRPFLEILITSVNLWMLYFLAMALNAGPDGLEGAVGLFVFFVLFLFLITLPFSLRYLIHLIFIVKSTWKAAVDVEK